MAGKLPIVVLAIVVVVLGAAFGVYYVQASGTITSLNQTVTSQSSQMSSQSSQISSQSTQISTQASQIAAQVQQITTDNAKITSLNSTVGSLQTQVTSLQSQVATDQTKISLLTTKDTKANQTIASLNSQITTLNSQITSLNSQISPLESQISSLQAQIASLQTITGLSQSTSEVSSQSFSTGTTAQVQVASFAANYAGYVAITVTAASDYSNEGAETCNVYASSVNSPTYGQICIPGGASGYFEPLSGIPDTGVFPVLPGTVTVYLVTADSTAQSATLSVTYYY